MYTINSASKYLVQTITNCTYLYYARLNIHVHASRSLYNQVVYKELILVAVLCLFEHVRLLWLLFIWAGFAMNMPKSSRQLTREGGREGADNGLSMYSIHVCNTLPKDGLHNCRCRPLLATMLAACSCMMQYCMARSCQS